MPPPDPGNKRINSRFIDRIIADQAKLTPLRLWLKSYLYAYIILRHLNDSRLWDQPVDRTIKLKDLFNVKWGMVRTIDRMLSERLSKKKDANKQNEAQPKDQAEQPESDQKPDQTEQPEPAQQQDQAKD